MEWVTGLLPGWLVEWMRVYVVPFLKIQVRVMARALLTGMTDTLLFLSLPITISLGSQSIWNARYELTLTQQAQIERWASVAQLIAYRENVPPVVPLVLWYKENSLGEENPNNCEGIMGLYTAVSTGELPCFPPGPQTPWEIIRQLQLGTHVFKTYCPEITYTTTDPKLIKKCYLYYNAGPRSRMNPDASAYVMNGYDALHQNMVLTDVQGRQHRLTALGAWPVHLAIQAQLAQRSEPIAAPILLAPAMLLQELLDKIWTLQEGLHKREDSAIPPGIESTAAALTTPATCRAPVVQDCFIAPHTDGDMALRPAGSPLFVAPTKRGELMCGLFPGIDLIPDKASLVVAPMPGQLIRYTDGNGNLTIQIENDEWIVWIIGLRSYTAAEGAVTTGVAIGAVSGAGSYKPGVHYAVYDKVNAGFVDALSFIPADMCPPTD
ncbi:MAG TPA: hypothetical protein PLJ78_03465 [Anaerolineae bacterium]|nr:hypothetical protein [Anaerolineae bacterium]HQK12987.1 hypothetical protein [Anaerolineae bacterium]